MAKDTEPEKISYSAYDHIKKEVAQKQKQANLPSTATGIPGVIKVFFVAIVIFGALLGSGMLNGPLVSFNNGGTNSVPVDTSNGAQVVDLKSLCVNHGGVSQHYHYQLSLQVNGQAQPIPANVGISSTCMNPIHTHDAFGKVHIELPPGYNGPAITVHDFFYIWGKDFTATSLLGNAGTVSMTVNGASINTNPAYVPSDRDVVVISVTTS